MAGILSVSRDRWRINATCEEHFGRLVEFRCPDCGLWSTLWEKNGGHGIGHDGAVTPSVVCPFDHVSCKFHRFVRLEGWSVSGEEARPRIARKG